MSDERWKCSIAEIESCPNSSRPRLDIDIARPILDRNQIDF